MSDVAPTASPDHRAKVAVLALLVIGTVAFSLFLNKPGHIVGDESVYHLMARSFANSGSLALLNGYEEFPSAELVIPVVTHPYAGHLFAQYPYFYSVLAAPFYLAFGYQGLFFLNLLAFLGSLWLCYSICQRLFKDRDMSLNACLVLVLATYAWEYSQAAWPHAVSMFFVAAVFYLALLAFQAASRGRAVALAFAAGLAAGLGTGVRFEVIFVAPILVLPFLFASPLRLGPIVAAGLGLVPGLAALSLTNSIKFGTYSPLSYGGAAAGPAAVTSYLPLFFVGAGFLFVLWLLTRPRFRPLAVAHPWWLAAGAATVGGAAMLSPEVWALVWRLGHGTYQLFVDLRIRDLAILEGALTRGPSGSMIYMESLKKSLLQSCPYLVLLVFLLVRLPRAGKDAPALSLAMLVPATFIPVYGYFAWHGGQTLNLRYFLPILPFTSILTGYVWRDIARQLGPSPWGRMAGMVLAGALVVALVIVAPLNNQSIEQLEPILLSLPLVLGGGLLIALLGNLVSLEKWRLAFANASLAGLVVTFMWAATVAFTYDYPRAWAVRAVRHTLSTEISALVSPDSITFAWYATPLSGLYDLERVRLAQTTWDDFADFRPLLEFHMEAGRPVFGWFQTDLWEEIEDKGYLAGLRAIPLHEVEGLRFARIVEQSSTVAEAGEPEE